MAYKRKTTNKGRTYVKSGEQWWKQYNEYLARFHQIQMQAESKIKRRDPRASTPIHPLPMSPEEFREQYTIARNTNIAATGKSGDVIKTMLERGTSSPFTLSKAQAKALQAELAKQGKNMTIQELRVYGGQYLTEYNDMLKAQGFNGTQRADKIGETFFGSP